LSNGRGIHGEAAKAGFVAADLPGLVGMGVFRLAGGPAFWSIEQLFQFLAALHVPSGVDGPLDGVRPGSVALRDEAALPAGLASPH